MCINMSKVCTECKQTKTHCEFSKSKKGKFGLNSKCKKCISNYLIKYNLKNKDNIKKYNKEYREKEENKDKQRKYQRKRNKKKIQNPIYKLKHYLGIYINQGIKNIKGNKQKSSFEVVGLESWDLLKEHIENQWVEGMTWSNHGIGKNNTTWHIDHIIPINSATTEDEVYKLNHYTNLRPMWGSDNIRKKDKIL